MTCVVSPDKAWKKEQDLSEKYAFPSEPERDGSLRDYRRSFLDDLKAVGQFARSVDGEAFFFRYADRRWYRRAGQRGCGAGTPCTSSVGEAGDEQHRHRHCRPARRHVPGGIEPPTLGL